jgi:uncharacterized cupredoxin-like copper-binding protein
MRRATAVLGAKVFAIATVIASSSHAQPMTSPPPAVANATPVNVALSSFNISPAEIALARGVTYRLHLTNTSGTSHNFSAPELFAASLIAPPDRAKVEDGKVEVDGGQTVDIVFVPMVAGEYETRCTHFLHSALGMHGKAMVK